MQVAFFDQPTLREERTQHGSVRHVIVSALFLWSRDANLVLRRNFKFDQLQFLNELRLVRERAKLVLNVTTKGIRHLRVDRWREVDEFNVLDLVQFEQLNKLLTTVLIGRALKAWKRLVHCTQPRQDVFEWKHLRVDVLHLTRSVFDTRPFA